MRFFSVLALALLTLAACDSNEFDKVAGRYVATTLDLERAGDGRYDALATGGFLTLTLKDDGRVSGAFAPGRDDSNGPDAPAPPSTEFDGTYRLTRGGAEIDSESLPYQIPSLFDERSGVLSAEENHSFTGGYRIVLERR